MENIASWPFEKRLEDVFWRSLPKVGPDAAEQLRAVISPEALAIMAGVIVAWIVSHAFGVGAVIDVILVTSGVLCMGMVVFSGVDELYSFASRTYNARTTADLEAAADHLAKAIAIIGVTAALTVLFRGSPGRAVFTRGPKVTGPLPYTGGWRYRPEIIPDPKMPASIGGRTTPWGDIVISTNLPAKERALVLAHEQGHQFLKPKLYLLRKFRIENQLKSYFHSSLWRYLEEALMETQAQLRAGSFLESFGGVAFPVMGGYVYLLRGGASAKYLGEAASVMKGYGLLPEAAALLTHGLIAGVQFDLWFSQQPPAEQIPPPPAMTEPRPSAGRRW
jgi:hypothetical protein